MAQFDNKAPVSNQAVNQYIYQYSGVPPPNSTRREEPLQTYDLGIRIDEAPQISEEYFVGRGSELEQLHTWLTPRPQCRNVVVLCGLGGMGKTQLSVRYAQRFGDRYSLVFWLNAKDESTLKAGMVEMAMQVMEDPVSGNVADAQEEERIVRQAREWLSRRGNEGWLLVYDNYDDPRLPGIDSSTGYDIRNFFPKRAQGSILITTRSQQLTFGKKLQLQKLDDVDQSLTILATRSGRNVKEDPDAIALARRLDGLPLALATAGTYLSQTPDSFGDYLRLYNDSWNGLDQHSAGPLDYEDRTLYSTWNLSLTLVRSQNAAAAELLRLIGYLGHQDLWYELFQGGAADQPMWWAEVSHNRARFNRAMSVLHNYSLVEVGAGRYSLHTCVHDWIVEYLNSEFDGDLCRLAIHCIAESVQRETEAEYWVRNRRVLQHVRRLEDDRLKALIDWGGINVGDICRIADLYRQGDMSGPAEEMYLRALQGCEKVCGAEHTSILDTVNNLGNLYADQGKVAEAEERYLQALRGYEKVCGAEHTSTLNTINNLGLLYTDQGKAAEAEDMYLRALRGYEKAWGVEHTLTLDTVNNLGLLYVDQSKMAEAEEMYLRALRGYEKAWGAEYTSEHTLTLNTVNNLGNLYKKQGKVAEAEDMYLRALRGYEKAWGVEHTSTLDTVNNLGNLYADQGKVAEAEEMYLRALRGYEKVCGAEHRSTLNAVGNLGLLYANRSEMAEAEEMYLRALRGKEKAWGAEHMSTLDTINNLGNLYADQGKVVKAEEMYLRALQGCEKVCGPEHTSTSDTVNNLGLLYADQGKVAEAEEMYLQALRGYEKAWGAEHISTLDTVNNLGNLYKKQGKMAEAEEMYLRALQGYEKARGEKHTSTLNTINNLGNVYKNQGKVVEAEEMYLRALRGYEKAWGREHLSVGRTVNYLRGLYFEQIWKQTFQSEEIVCDKSQILDKIFNLAYAWGSTSRRMFGTLGRIFLWASDEPNAQIAFQQEIEVWEGVSVYAHIECDGCRRPLTCAMQRLVCKRCQDVDICDECYRKHQMGLKISTCSDHTFWAISSDTASSSSQGDDGERIELLWLRTLMKRHSAAEFDCDNASSK